MTTVILGLDSGADLRGRFLAAAHGEPQGAFIGFASAELLWRVLTARRWEILRVMTGAGPLSIREVARRAGRDVKAVHGDVSALLAAGLLDRDGRAVVFPYDAVRVDFTLAAAA
jgi:predicted transcriptional regulator